jgi:predicted metal-binding protein
LLEALRTLAATDGPPALSLREVSCLWNCSRGCSVAISMAGKWSFLLGQLSPAHAPDLLAYAALYAASSSGSVFASRRPAALRRAIVGRIPPMANVA